MKTYKLLIPAIAMFAISNGAFAAYAGLSADEAKTYVTQCKVVGKDNTDVIVMTKDQVSCENVKGTVVTTTGN